MNYKSMKRQQRASHDSQIAWNATFNDRKTVPQPTVAPEPIIVETHAEQEQYYADLASVTTNAPVQQVELWHLSERSNYRQHYDQTLIETIAASIASNGFDPAHPIKVYADDNLGYVIIDGHTRYKAALLASPYSIKELHRPTLLVWINIVDKPTDGMFALMQAVENNNRAEPDEVSKAHNFRTMLDNGITYEQIRAQLGINRDVVDRHLALLSLVPDVQEFVSKGQLGIKFACAMADLDSNRQRIALKSYNRNHPLLAEFTLFCSDLLEKQMIENADQLFNLSALETKADEQLVSIMTESRKSRADLEKELDATRLVLQAEKQARKADQAWAIKAVKKLQTENAALKALYNAKVA